MKWLTSVLPLLLLNTTLLTVHHHVSRKKLEILTDYKFQLKHLAVFTGQLVLPALLAGQMMDAGTMLWWTVKLM